MIDSVGISSSLIALRMGAPKAVWLTFVGGASLLVALGIAALATEQDVSPE